MKNHDVIYSCREVQAMVSLGRTTIYRLIGQNKFPKPLKLSAGRVGWKESDLNEWLKQRAAEGWSSQSAA